MTNIAGPGVSVTDSEMEVAAAPEAVEAAAEPAEPEVLRKGKAVVEEEGEEKKEK